jgi:hypothetical protein
MMSEQAKILAELQEIIMRVISSGSASEAEGKRIDELEELLHQQKCYKEIDHNEYSYQGEEIAGLLFTDHTKEAIEKMFEYEITPDEFFGFIEYHDEDEEFTEMFTDTFILEVSEVYQSKC